MPIFEDALKEYGLGSGEKLKLADGENQIRVLFEPKFIQTMFKGNVSKKFVMWVIDRKHGKQKLLHAAKTIVNYLADPRSEGIRIQCEANNSRVQGREKGGRMILSPFR
jgi:hypothetical protein